MEKNHYNVYWRSIYSRKKRKKSWLDRILQPLPNEPYFFSLINDILPETKDKIILDIGCGESIYLSRIVNDKIKIGMDVSILPIIKAKSSNSSMLFVLGDGNYLPFKENSFDVIYCTEVIEHFCSPDKVINQIYCCLKESGVCFITTPLRKKADHLIRKIPFGIKYLVAKILHIDTEPLVRQRESRIEEHPSEFSETEFKRFLIENNFKLLRYRRMDKNILRGTQAVLISKALGREKGY
jgi:ubiquinone/menaquinone biosynthesis C-methylase UbiE